jgi:hypothetical protein
METYTAEDKRPVDRCLSDVRSCDLYIGVFAWRYGYVPDGYDQSITELEYRAAAEAGIDCLIFLPRRGSTMAAREHGLRGGRDPNHMTGRRWRTNAGSGSAERSRVRHRSGSWPETPCC